MWDLDELVEENEKLLDNNLDVAKHLSNLGDECFHIGSEFGRIGEILDDIDREFSEATGIINRKDLQFLFVATSLLCAKWVIMGNVAPLDFDFKHNPNERERISHDKGDEIAEEKRKKHKKYGELENANDMSEDAYRTVNQIIFRPVPYDATQQTALSLVPDRLGGKSKRAYAWGHDPIFGWLFGTVNIMTRSVTFKLSAFDTYKVSEKGINIKLNQQSTFPTEMYHAIMSFREDNKRLPAAVFKQGLHLLADKYTKLGLPIPFLSPEKAFELMEKGWNSVEAAAAIKKVLAKTAKNVAIIGTQFIISLLINEIIKAIHLMMYDEEKDNDIQLYQVRTRKILLTANCISSTSNVLFCAIFGALTKNPLEAAKRLDIGGFIETTRRLVVDTRFIKEIKREYIRKNLAEIILNKSDFDWWYVNEKGEISYE